MGKLLLQMPNLSLILFANGPHVLHLFLAQSHLKSFDLLNEQSLLLLKDHDAPLRLRGVKHLPIKDSFQPLLLLHLSIVRFLEPFEVAKQVIVLLELLIQPPLDLSKALSFIKLSIHLASSKAEVPD